VHVAAPLVLLVGGALAVCEHHGASLLLALGLAGAVI